MNNNPFKALLNEEDIINIKENFDILMQSKMFEINDLKKAIMREILSVRMETIEGNTNRHSQRLKWINEGLECEILNIGDNRWKNGKIRIKISLEFCPDEPGTSEYKSPLDEIRNHPSFPNS